MKNQAKKWRFKSRNMFVLVRIFHVFPKGNTLKFETIFGRIKREFGIKPKFAEPKIRG